MTSKTLPPIHPNIGIESDYARRLEALVEAMHKSIMYWVLRSYQSNQPHTVMAQDDSSAVLLDKLIKRLSRYWQRSFNAAAVELAKYFAKKNTQRTDNSLEQILKESGFAIKFKVTPAANDVLQATVKANVALITNMSQQHLKEIQGMVMRSVQTGRDIGTLAKQLEARYDMTKKRARLIARDQNNKATAALTRIRQVEIGVTQAKWLHSHAGREPRPTHLANNGKLYDVRKGWFDPDANGKGKGAWIYPGYLINCRCVSRSVIPELGVR